MQVSAEVRWFWKDTCPDSVEIWFTSGNFPADSGAAREDTYFYDPAQQELGMKKRGAKAGIELKGLVAVLPAQKNDRLVFGSPVEIWCKWSSLLINPTAYRTVSIIKVRRLRMFDTSATTAREIEIDEDERPIDGQPLPTHGCNLELTQVKIGKSGRTWWTLGFEAFGELEAVESNLRKAVDASESFGPLPAIGSGEALSYPAWLAKYAALA